SDYFVGMRDRAGGDPDPGEAAVDGTFDLLSADVCDGRRILHAVAARRARAFADLPDDRALHVRGGHDDVLVVRLFRLPVHGGEPERVALQVVEVRVRLQG